MPSSTFHFKQFSIQQDRCAMKVSTDGILLGSWADGSSSSRALDIGTGTGILALMLAQRNPQLRIDAVELDQAAFEQASENVAASIFSKQIQLHHGTIQAFSHVESYDLIISNPPYFETSKLGSDEHRRQARQQSSLSHSELLGEVNKRMEKSGIFFLILPAQSYLSVSLMCKELSLFIRKKTGVRYKAHKDIGRYLLEIKKERGPLKESELVIQHGDSNDYTDAFIELSRDFYAFMP